MPRKYNWMSHCPIGKLASTTKTLYRPKYDMDRDIARISPERKSLFEDYRSGYITLEELRTALKALGPA